MIAQLVPAGRRQITAEQTVAAGIPQRRGCGGIKTRLTFRSFNGICAEF